MAIALVVYAVTTGVYFAFAAPGTLRAHTPFNHFALLADSWLHGRLDLGGPPPPYAQNNDFASFGGKWFVTFPPFPAVLLLPLVKLAGSAESLDARRATALGEMSRSQLALSFQDAGFETLAERAPRPPGQQTSTGMFISSAVSDPCRPTSDIS